jgi:hypothetical protein
MRGIMVIVLTVALVVIGGGLAEVDSTTSQPSASTPSPTPATRKQKLKSKEEYDAKCQLMIQYAQRAAKAFNEGDKDEAETFVSKVQDTFKAAVELHPDEPQAYANMATFYSNSHKSVRRDTFT